MAEPTIVDGMVRGANVGSGGAVSAVAGPEAQGAGGPVDSPASSFSPPDHPDGFSGDTLPSVPSARAADASGWFSPRGRESSAVANMDSRAVFSPIDATSFEAAIAFEATNPGAAMRVYDRLIQKLGPREVTDEDSKKKMHDRAVAYARSAAVLERLGGESMLEVWQDVDGANVASLLATSSSDYYIEAAECFERAGDQESASIARLKAAYAGMSRALVMDSSRDYIAAAERYLQTEVLDRYARERDILQSALGLLRAVADGEQITGLKAEERILNLVNTPVLERVAMNLLGTLAKMIEIHFEDNPSASKEVVDLALGLLVDNPRVGEMWREGTELLRMCGRRLAYVEEGRGEALRSYDIALRMLENHLTGDDGRIDPKTYERHADTLVERAEISDEQDRAAYLPRAITEYEKLIETETDVEKQMGLHRKAAGAAKMEGQSGQYKGAQHLLARAQLKFGTIPQKARDALELDSWTRSALEEIVRELGPLAVRLNSNPEFMADADRAIDTMKEAATLLTSEASTKLVLDTLDGCGKEGVKENFLRGLFYKIIAKLIEGIDSRDVARFVKDKMDELSPQSKAVRQKALADAMARFGPAEKERALVREAKLVYIQVMGGLGYSHSRGDVTADELSSALKIIETKLGTGEISTELAARMTERMGVLEDILREGGETIERVKAAQFVTARESEVEKTRIEVAIALTSGSSTSSADVARRMREIAARLGEQRRELERRERRSSKF